MSRFYFVHEESSPYTRVSIETDAVSLDDVLNEFENFLRGSGYHINGRLEVVDWEVNKQIPEPSQDFLDHFEHRN